VVCHGRSPSSGAAPAAVPLPDVEKERLVDYTLADAKKRTATVSDLREVPQLSGQWKRHAGRRDLCLLGYRPPSPDSVFATYRLRFGSRRVIASARGDPDHARRRRCAAVRGIALVLRNLWCGCTTRSCRGPPWRSGVLLERLRWGDAAAVVLHVVEEAFGVADVTYTERDVEWLASRRSSD